MVCGIFLNQVMACPEFRYSTDLVKFLSENDDKFKTYSEVRRCNERTSAEPN